MKETDNGVFELSEEELAKVVGGVNRDVPTVTLNGGTSVGAGWDNSAPGVMAPCGKTLHYAEESCSEPVNDRTWQDCPTCPHNH